MQRVFTSQDAAAVRRLSRHDSQLGKKVRSAMEIIDQAIERYGAALALSFNGGKDCWSLLASPGTVLAHLYAAAVALKTASSPSSPSSSPRSPSSSAPSASITRPRTSNGHHPATLACIYVQCQSPFPQVEEFVDRCSARYSLDLCRISAPMKEALRRYKIDREMQHAQRVEAVLVGTRIGDPYSEKLSPFAMTDSDWPQLMRVHPILDWTYADIWDFLRSPDLGDDAIEWCTLYNFGYTSLGSTFNTIPNPELRDPSRPSGWKAAWELKDASAERAGRPAGPIAKEVTSPLAHPTANGHKAPPEQ